MAEVAVQKFFQQPDFLGEFARETASDLRRHRQIRAPEPQRLEAQQALNVRHCIYDHGNRNADTNTTSVTDEMICPPKVTCDLSGLIQASWPG